ncbi:OmpA family protein [Rudanella lutea]|uniref:OmpA family protein n=1 Tax=Rudanella lutea TaxID=451374 RepID=UPI00037FB507|nr:OmpA family protein [Rudanella lutea]
MKNPIQVRGGAPTLTHTDQFIYEGRLFGPSGASREVNVFEKLIGLGFELTRKNDRTHRGWGLTAGGVQQTHVIGLETASYLSSKYLLIYRYLGFGGGIKRFWENPDKNVHYFVHLSARYATNAREHTIEQKWPKVTEGGVLDYVERGTGYRMINRAPTANWAICPEVGVQWGGTVPVRLSIQYVKPLTDPLFLKQFDYYQSNLLRSSEVLSLSQHSVVLNLGIPLTIFEHTFRRQPRVQPTPKPKQPQVTSKPAPPAPKPVLPPTDTLPVVKPAERIRLNNVLFAPSRADLFASSYAELDSLVSLMLSRPTLVIRLEGHTDKIGETGANQQLSENRVRAIKTYVVSNGVAADRITTVGYGDTRPICPSPCAENRRVEFVIVRE